MNDRMLSTVRDYVKERLGNGYRFAHVLRVEEECIRLAKLFSLSDEQTERLRLAALLHDVTKQASTEEQKALYRKYGVPFGETEAHSPKTLHAITGAYVAKEAFPEAVTNEVFRCILRHTTGAPDMTLPEKLLYLADYIEPGRTFPSCVRLREAFYRIPPDDGLISHLNRILILSFDQTLTELVEEHAYIHPTTNEARNYLLAHP